MFDEFARSSPFARRLQGGERFPFLSRIAEELGTPCLVYWADRFSENVAWLRSGLLADNATVRIAFALKACSHVEIARLAEREGLWCEVMSLGEWEIARGAGFSGDRIIVNGLGWEDELIRRAIMDGAILINVDNSFDLQRVGAVAQAAGREVPVGVRIIPDVGRSLFTPVGGKLGASVSGGEAAKLLKEASSTPGVRCVAVSTHACHRLREPQVLAEITRSTIQFAEDQRAKLGLSLDFVDIGGGLDDRAMIDRLGFDAAAFFRPVTAAVSSLGQDVQLVLEPGRLLIGDAGMVLTRVRLTKTSSGRNWVIVDAGTNLLVPIPAAHFEVLAVDVDGPLRSFSVADGICSPSSVIQNDAQLPEKINRGCLLVVTFAGAYTFSLAENWAYPVPPVALVDDGQVLNLLGREASSSRFDHFVGVLQ